MDISLHSSLDELPIASTNSQRVCADASIIDVQEKPKGLAALILENAKPIFDVLRNHSVQSCWIRVETTEENPVTQISFKKTGMQFITPPDSVAILAQPVQQQDIDGSLSDLMTLHEALTLLSNDCRNYINVSGKRGDFRLWLDLQRGQIIPRFLPVTWMTADPYPFLYLLDAAHDK